MMRMGILIGVLAMLPVLAAQGQEPEPAAEDADRAPLDVETILTTPSETEYAESPRCLSTSRIRRTEVLDDRHIVFHMSRDQYYLVQFPHRCPTLERNSGLMYDVEGSRLCQMNRIRAINGSGMSRSIGPVCMVPGFQEVSVEQVALLRESVEQMRRSKRSLPIPPADEDTPQQEPPAEAPPAEKTPAAQAAEETAPASQLL